MNDVSTQDIERLVSEIANAAGSMRHVGDLMKQRTNDERQQRRDLFKGVIASAGRFEQKMVDSVIPAAAAFTKGFEQAVNQLQISGRKIVGAIALAGILRTGIELSKTYRELTEVGQTFGGSMFEMMQAASAAGLPLEQFARIQKRYNATIDATQGSYWKINRELRQNIAANGLYGMSVDQLAEFTGDYLEVSRLNGSFLTRSNQQLATDMGDLALTTTALAKASDKTREDITKLAAAAMSSALAITAIHSLPADVRGAIDKSVKEVTVGFASLNGEAGDFFSKFFNETLGGNAALTQQGNVAISAGMSGLASEMDAFARKVKTQGGTAGDAIRLSNKFKDDVEANSAVLNSQVLAGNENAAQLIKMAAAIRRRTDAEIAQAEQDAKNQKKITAFFNSIESVWQDMTGMFKSGFLKGFQQSMQTFDEFSKRSSIKRLGETLEKLGMRVGSILGTFLTGSHVDDLIHGIESVATTVLNFAQALAKDDKLWTVASQMVVAFGNVLKIITVPMRIFASLLSKMNSSMLVALGVGVGLFKLGKIVTSVLQMVRGFKASSMQVTAGVVNVNGGSGGLGGAGGGGKGKGFGGKVGAGLKGLAGGVGLSLLGMGAEYAADNYTKEGSTAQTAMGAGGRALSYGALGATVGSFIPGVGTLAGGLVGGAYGGISGLMDYGSREAKAPQGASAAAAAAIAKSNQDLIETAIDNQGKTGAIPVIDPMQMLIDETKRQTDLIAQTANLLATRIEQGNRLLSKIEVSAQSL